MERTNCVCVCVCVYNSLKLGDVGSFRMNHLSIVNLKCIIGVYKENDQSHLAVEKLFRTFKLL